MRETWKMGIMALTLVALLSPTLVMAAGNQGAANAQVAEKAALMQERRELRKQMNSKGDPATAQQLAANGAKLRALAKAQKGGK